jgi:CHAT domain-containing protein/tetratricopeptide (TPR) repeat protein
MLARLLLCLLLIVSSGPAAAQDARKVDPSVVQRFVDATPESRREIAAGLTPADATALRSALQETAIGHARQGRPQEAIRLLDAAWLAAEREDSPRGRLNVLLARSQTYGTAGDYDQAVRSLDEVVALSRPGPDADIIAAAANNLGNIYRRRGQYDLALESYQRSLDFNQAPGREAPLGRTLNNIGAVHQQRGDFRMAIDYFLQSLAIKERVGQPDELISTLGNIGGVYALQGNRPQAIAYMERTYALAEKYNDVRQMITTAANLGRVLMDSGRFAESETRLTRARELAEKSGYNEQLAGVLNALANLASARKQWAPAAEHLVRARQIYEGLGDPIGMGQVLMSQATVAIGQGRGDDGIALALQARETLAAIGRPTVVLDAEVLLGEAFANARRWSDAVATYERAIDLTERGLDMVAGDVEDRFRFLESTGNAYFGLAHAYASSGRGADALAAAERGRARTLLEMMGGESADDELTDAERSRRIELETAMTALNERLAAERARTKTGARIDPALSAELDRLRRTRNEFDLGLDATHQRRGFARGRAPVLSADAIAATLPPRSGLVEFVVGPRGTWVMLLIPSKKGPPRLVLKAAPLPTARLATLAADFTRQVSTRDLSFAASARALYDAVLGPIDAEIAALDQLIIVPHGPLWDVPFQALQTPRQKYVIEEHALSYAPSASTLNALERRAHPRPARPRVVAFGDPRLADRAAAPLPNAAREARDVADIYGSEMSVVAIDADATETRFRQVAPRADIIHVATHGVLDNSSPMFSYVSLTGDGTRTAADGRLEGRELINLHLDAELIVLSACETARGRIANGEGVVGLSWSLFAAGASTTTVSLWPVDSASTTELMAAFHRERRRLIATAASAPTAQALRAAQLKALATAESRHPFYWAGFVVIGVP